MILDTLGTHIILASAQLGKGEQGQSEVQLFFPW